MDIPEDKKSDELKVRTWEYLKVREYWKKKIEEGVVGPKSKMHPEPVFVPAPPLDKKLPKLIPHECRPADLRGVIDSMQRLVGTTPRIVHRERAVVPIE